MAKQATMALGEKTASHARDHDFGKYDFIKLAPVMGGISAILTIIAFALIFTKGLNYGIDFAGGTEIQVRFSQPVEMGALRKAIEEVGIVNPGVQSFGGSNEFLIRLETPRASTERETNEMINANVAKVK